MNRPQQCHCFDLSFLFVLASSIQQSQKEYFSSLYIFQIHTIISTRSGFWTGSNYTTTSFARKQLMVGRSHDFKAQMIRYSKLLNFCTYTVWTPAKRFSASGPRPKIKSRLPRVNCLRATRPNIDSYVLKQKHFGFRAFQCSRIAAPFPPLPRCAFGASEYAVFFYLVWIE